MGEEAKQEEAKPETKQEEKKEEKAKEKQEEKPEEKKEEPKPPSPVILFVDMHCVGCAKRVERCIRKCRGVEDVEVDMNQNTVKIKGIVNPEAICTSIQKKTKRRATVLSPLPPPEGEDSKPVVTSQVSGPATVVLNVNMHCEACAEQLKSKILKMRGVQSADTELSTSKVTVTGTMEAEKLVDYVYRRTRKLAKIVPQPEEKAAEEKKPEEAPKEPEKPPEEAAKAEEKKDDNAEKKEEEKPAQEAEKDKNAGSEEKAAEAAAAEAPKAEGEEVALLMNDDMAKRVMYWPPMYVIQHVPPPQLFSDENPNACCIS